MFKVIDFNFTPVEKFPSTAEKASLSFEEYLNDMLKEGWVYQCSRYANVGVEKREMLVFYKEVKTK